ncbi:hypothetical protein [[Mycobacterium] appelbergii]|nr:hypothetical protein [Mycobacterium sp. 21AC1]
MAQSTRLALKSIPTLPIRTTMCPATSPVKLGAVHAGIVERLVR